MIHSRISVTSVGRPSAKSKGWPSISNMHQNAQHFPIYPLYREGEAKLQCTGAAKTVAAATCKAVVDPCWLDSTKAEAAAKKTGGEMWRGQLVVTFGKYAGQTFRWLLENDVGWVVWLLEEYCQKGETNGILKWQKGENAAVC
ncbi:hypothetical protein WMY93_012931 [Mugilogobius chulae]|uniref:Uncharacterized protein n=1 Tax=Mugilogobius chulae TaxID=88201 RepID=A0AAW0P7S9_9GOBI